MSDSAQQQSSAFALLGAAGFIAPRHMKALLETNNRLTIACDHVDSVGTLDSYFPLCTFHLSYDAFLHELETQSRTSSLQQYCVICTPNYLHAKQIEDVLKRGCHVICEKPLVLTIPELKKIAALSKQYSRHVYSVHQLRLHPAYSLLKTYVEKKSVDSPEQKMEVQIKYHAPRGHWYLSSWKFDHEKSGGLLFNIGIHLFDILLTVFGNPEESFVKKRTDRAASGVINFRNARVSWDLSIDIHSPGVTLVSERSFIVDGEKFDFSQNFENLHTSFYRSILKEDDSTPLVSFDDVQHLIQLIESLYSAPVLSADSM